MPTGRISADMPLFPVNWNSVLGLVGFSSSAFNTDTYAAWFLQALFLMRVAVHPVLGHMRTAPLLLCVFLGYAHYVLTATSPRLDHPDSPFTETLVYIPYFVAGYVLHRHGVIKAYVEWAGRNPGKFRILQAISLACLLGLTW